MSEVLVTVYESSGKERTCTVLCDADDPNPDKYICFVKWMVTTPNDPVVLEHMTIRLFCPCRGFGRMR